MEAIVRESGRGLAIIIPEDIKKKYHFKEHMVFEIFAEKERIILKLQEKTKRDKLADEFNSINLNDFEKYKQETLSPFLDRNRFFGIARGSALECATIQDVLFVGNAITEEEYQYPDTEKKLLLRIVSMLSKMSKKSWSVNEENAHYGNGIDHDNDHDHDNDEDL